MAVPSTFQERLQQMEETRNQRLSLLQAEKEIKIKKFHLLNEKLSSVRSIEQRCLLLEKRNAELRFQTLAKKSEIDALEGEYQASARQFRVLRGQLDELEEREKERDRFYGMKRLEMQEFKDRVRKRISDARLEVENMRINVSELKSTLKELQGNDGYLNNAEIAAAERRKTELSATKEELDKSLASNYQLRSLLQKQLQKLLVSHEHTSKKMKP